MNLSTFEVFKVGVGPSSSHTMGPMLAARFFVINLEAKGLLRHRLADQSYVYKSVPQPAKVRESALRQMVKTFFDGSAANAATALLGLSKNLDPEELDALQRAIDEVRERGA